MKTLSTTTATEKNKRRGKKILTLVEIDTSGGTVYYSDHPVIVDSQRYSPQVISWNRVESQIVPGENVIRISGWRVQLSNNPRIESILAPGQEVRGFQYFKGLGVADKIPLFRGIIKGATNGNLYDIQIIAEDIGEYHNKFIGTLLDPTTYPNADPDDWNKMITEVFGPINNLPCLWMEAGFATTLRGEIDDIVTTIPVMSTISPLTAPSSGNLRIGDEIIPYSGKTDTTFTGATRGSSAVSHSDGDSVLDNDATVKAVVGNHEFKSISNIRILPRGLRLQDAVAIDPADYTINLDDSGQATIELNNIPAIQRKVAIAVTQQPDQPITTQPDQPITTQPDQPITTQPDQPITTQPDQPITTQPLFSGSADHSHVIDGLSQVSIYGDGVDSSSGATNTGNAFDRNFDTTFSTLTYISPSSAHLGLDFGYSSFDGLVIKEAVACIRASVDIGSNVAKLRLPGSTFGLLNQDLNIGGGVATQKFPVGGLVNETDWSKLDTLRILVSGPGGPLITKVYQIWWEIAFEPVASTETLSSAASNRTTDAVSNRTTNAVSNRTTNAVSNRTTDAVSNRITDAEVGGDSVASTLQGPIICDVEGWPDTGAGHYTGTPDDLIIEPWDIIHKILETYANGPVAHADIDLAGSFADAEANLPGSYEFGFAITRQIELNQLLAGLAWQCWCRFRWAPEYAKLIRIKDSGSAVKTINTDTDSILDSNNRLQVGFIIPGLDNEGIANNILLHYNSDPSLGSWGDAEAYQGLAEDSDAGSITAYETRKKILLAFAIGDNSAMAVDLADKFLTRNATPRRSYSFPSTLANMELEPGDIVSFTCPPLDIDGLLCEVLGIDYIPPMPIQKQGSETWITLLDLT